MSGSERQNRAMEIEIAARMAGMDVEEFKEALRGVRRNRDELAAARDARMAEIAENPLDDKYHDR